MCNILFIRWKKKFKHISRKGEKGEKEKEKKNCNVMQSWLYNI